MNNFEFFDKLIPSRAPYTGNFETLQYCSRGNNVDISNRREVVSMARFSWRRQLRFIGHFHVIARGPNFIYTRRKVGARYYLDLLQLLEFPLQTRLAWQRLFQRELQRRRFEIFKYLHSIRGWTTNFATPFEKSICADLFRSSKSREIVILY